jgi:hypothetical protein
MISISNELFEPAKIKCELEFISRNNFWERYEYLKHLIRTQFSEFIIELPNDGLIHNDKYFLKFYEGSDHKNKLESTSTIRYF